MTEKEKEAEKAEEKESEEGISEDKEQEPSLDELQTELEATKKALKKANREAASRRKKLDKLEAADEERKAAELSDVQKLEKERDDAVLAAEKAMQAADAKLLKATIIGKAAELNFADPTDAFALLDKSELTLADDGSVEGLDDALKELAETKPYMLKQEKKGATRLGAAQPDMGKPGGETPAQRRERLGI